MAQFRAAIKGTRGPASRLGSPKSGIVAEANGWNSGVRVRGWTNEDGKDCFDVFMTPGSNDAGHSEFVGSVRMVDGKPVWESAS